MRASETHRHTHTALMLSYSYLSVWLLLLLAASGAVTSAEKVAGTVGKSEYLTVKLDLPAMRLSQWKVNTSIIIVTVLPGGPPSYTDSYRGRCHLYDNTTLRLDNLTPTDTGEYTLTVTNQSSGDTVTGSVYLTVYSLLTPPTLKVNVSTTNNNAYPINGTNVSLHCDAGGQNVVNYTFYKDDNITACSQPHVTCNKDFLYFQPITMSDTGRYTCKIENPISSSTSQPLSLTVTDLLTPPTLKVNVSTINDNVYPINGTNVSLHCDAGNQNVVNYTFYKDGVTVCSQPHVTCNKDFRYFQPITMSDTGRYTCKIENPFSSNTSQPLSIIVTVLVSNVTLSSNASGLITVVKDSVNLRCSALGTNVTFSWYLDGAPLPSDSRYHLMNSNSSLIISPVERTDNGFFTCTASNSLNNETSNPLTIAWSPDPIQCNARESTNQTLTLFCSWPGGNPPADVTLEFQNQNHTMKDIVNTTVPKANVTANNRILSCSGILKEKRESCVLPIAAPEGNQTNTDSTVTEGKPATMSVNLISNIARAVSQSLPAKFTWKNPQNTNITNGSNYTINSNDFWSELVIHKVTVSDNGTFKCDAENFMGISTFSFQLRIQEPVPGSNPPLSPGAIAGIVIGSLAGVALIATAVFFIVKSTKKKSNKDSSRNPEMNLTGVADKNKEDEEYVKYADLRFKNTNPSNNAASQQVPETEYSTVKR